MQAQALAAQLMIELCGATPGAGHVDVGGPGPAAAADPPARRAARGPARHRGPARALPASPRPRSSSGSPRSADGLDVTPPAFRRADVTREADVIEEVARLGGARRACRRRCPSPPRRAGGRLTPPPAPAPAGGRRARGAGPGRDRGLELHQPSRRRRSWARRAEEAVELENPMSAEQSRLRTTLLGSLLEIARRNRARGAARSACSRPAPCTCRAARTSCPASPTTWRRCCIGPLGDATWRDAGSSAGRLLHRQGRARPSLLARLRVPFTVRAGAAAVPAPRARGGDRDRRRARSAGSASSTRAVVAEEWELDGVVAGFELDLDACAAGRAGALRGPDELPRGA